MMLSTFTYITAFAIIMLLLSFIRTIDSAWRIVFALIAMACFALLGLLIWNVELPVVLSTDEITSVKVFKTYEMQNGMWASYAASVFSLISFLINLFTYFAEQKAPQWHKTAERVRQRTQRY